MIWFVALAGTALAGVTVQQVTEWQDRRRNPPPGRFVQLSDASVHVVVEGDGPPVLLDSGLGGSSLEWHRVAAALAPDFTVIRYDRPGLAWSRGSRCDRRALAAARRINELLVALDVSGPAVLVGHSIGGIHVRVAAALRPDLAAGLVLVDPSHEGMLDDVSASKAAAATRAVTNAAAALAPIGLGRLFGRGFTKLVMSERRLPLDAEDTERAHIAALLTSRSVHGLRAVANEYAALQPSLQQVVDLKGSEPDLPTTVITASAPSANPKAAAARCQIDALHAQLVANCPQGRQVLAERSGHLVPLDQPNVIVQCIRDLAAVRP